MQVGIAGKACRILLPLRGEQTSVHRSFWQSLGPKGVICVGREACSGAVSLPSQAAVRSRRPSRTEHFQRQTGIRSCRSPSMVPDVYSSCSPTRASLTPTGGIFKLELFLPEEYPMNPPKVRFLTKI